MKKIILVLSSFIISLAIYSQTYTGKDAQAIIPGSEMVVKDALLNTPSFIRFAKGSEIEFKQFGSWFADHIKTTSEFGFKLISSETDELGFTHYRYQQTYNGIPIHSNIFILHVRNDRIEIMNGRLFSSLDQPAVATLTEQEALNKALDYVGAVSYKWQMPGRRSFAENQS